MEPVQNSSKQTHSAVNDATQSLFIKKCPKVIQITEVPGYSNFVPPPFAVYSAGKFDKTGGHLLLPGTAVKLFIPPGAITDGTEQAVFLYISSEDRYLMPLEKDEVRLSPSVFCGPKGLTFEKEVFLRIPRWTRNEVKNWKLQIMCTKTDVNEDTCFQKTEECLPIVNDEFVTIIVDHFAGFGVKGKQDTSVA